LGSWEFAMTRSDVDTLRDRMADRDFAVLRDVDKFRLLTTKQIQQLHFDPHHPTALASARACNRALSRLRDFGVLKSLQRRIGGARAGSAGFVWYVGPAGERLMQLIEPTAPGGRRNYREPSRHFVEHTLAIADVALRIIQTERHGELELLELQTEPSSWQPFLSRFGTTQILKPDLRIMTAQSDFENHWFIEVDLASEHMPVILRQCVAYEAFRATGRYQAAYGLFPAVVWVCPTVARAEAIRAAVAATAGLDPALFAACASPDCLALLTAGTAGTP
jgi:hypothetical protein